MALGAQLQKVIEMVRDEAGLSSATSKGVDHLPHIRRLIRRFHGQLGREHEWPHMRIKRDDAGVSTEAGQRYYDWPAALDTSRSFIVWVKDGNLWERMEQGISPDHYNLHDSDAGDRSDPERWDWYGTGQFELWPVPDEVLQVRFEGVRLPGELVDDTDALDLDDEMIALFVAAEILEEKNQKVADRKRAQANRLLGRLKAGAPSSSRRIVIGGSDPTSMPRRGGTIYIRKRSIP